MLQLSALRAEGRSYNTPTDILVNVYHMCMLSNTLNTNEIKNAAGSEQEFQRISTNGRTTEFSLITETPIAPHRLKVSHQETGSGSTKRRRSVVRVDKTTTGADSLPVTTSFYIVGDIPVGDSSTYDVAKDVLANLLSFCTIVGTTGTPSVYDGTGNGAVTLLSGGL